MLRPLAYAMPGPLPSLSLADRPRPFPLLDRAFDAVERALARLGIEDPAGLPTPAPVEDELSDTALPLGTLLVLDPGEVAAARQDLATTVLDERLGGTVFGTMARPPAEDPARRRLRELGGVTTAVGFLPVGAQPYGVGRVRQVRSPQTFAGYELLAADTPGFRVALVSRALPRGGRITLWTGTPELVHELLGALRSAARADGHSLPPPAPEVPERDVVGSQAELWRQAEALRGQRGAREAELRQVARAAALRGVELRRQRDESPSRGSRAAS